MNTLPSGHTTAAMSLLFAVLIVMPYRFRGVAMFVALTWAVGIGAYTVVIGAHRLSDTLAADAVALIVGLRRVCISWPARVGSALSVSPAAARYTLRTVFVVLVGVVGAASLVLGLSRGAACGVGSYQRQARRVVSVSRIAVAGRSGVGGVGSAVLVDLAQVGDKTLRGPGLPPLGR